MHWDTYKQDNYSTVEGDGGCRVGEVRAGTTSPMPDHKGFKLQELSEIHPLTPAVQGLSSAALYSNRSPEMWKVFNCLFNCVFNCQLTSYFHLQNTKNIAKDHVLLW